MVWKQNKEAVWSEVFSGKWISNKINFFGEQQESGGIFSRPLSLFD